MATWSDSWLGQFALATIMSLYVGFSFALLAQTNKLRAKRRENFSKAIVEGLKAGIVQDANDVRNIYSGIFPGASTQDHVGMTSSLKRMLAEQLSSIGPKNKMNQEDLKKVKEALTNLIKKFAGEESLRRTSLGRTQCADRLEDVHRQI